MGIKLRMTIASLMALNLCACSTSAIHDDHPILDYEWQPDIYNMVYSTVADVDSFQFWVRRNPSFIGGSPHLTACVEVAQPVESNRFYMANLNTYGVLEVYGCDGDYSAFSNIVSSRGSQRLDKEAWLTVDGVSTTQLDNGRYRFTFTDLFPVNEYQLTEQGKRTLQKVVVQTHKWQVTHIRIYGVADSSGGYSNNQSLANARAQVVKEFLREEGVHQTPISLRGSVENGLPSAEERISQRRFMIEMKLETR